MCEDVKTKGARTHTGLHHFLCRRGLLLYSGATRKTFFLEIILPSFCSAREGGAASQEASQRCQR